MFSNFVKKIVADTIKLSKMVEIPNIFTSHFPKFNASNNIDGRNQETTSNISIYVNTISLLPFSFKS